MSLTKTLSKVGNLYSNNLKEHGVTSKSVGWPNISDHDLRFDKLFSNFDLDTISSLNDLGCGYGSALEYLIQKRCNIKTYFAYDISLEMLSNINIKHYNKIIIKKFHDREVVTKADFTIASGIFNVKFSENNSKWIQYILETLENINIFSEKGFSFNMLTSYVDFKKDDLFYADPMFFFDHCKKNFSQYITLYHDYKLWEWTIVVKK